VPARLQSFSSVFAVSDVGRSLAFFSDKLGFRVEFRMGDPVEYAIIERDMVSLHLMPASRDPSALGQARIYVFAAGVDALHEELRLLGCPIEMAPKDLTYGMREMSVRDPDGNRLTFGEEVKIEKSGV
jgi:catechol 2,3-dioxygenase-like lactoylglutathione lyase family enzyme